MAPVNTISKLSRTKEHALKQYCTEKLNKEGEKALNDSQARRLADEYQTTGQFMREWIRSFVAEWKKKDLQISLAAARQKADSRTKTTQKTAPKHDAKPKAVSKATVTQATSSSKSAKKGGENEEGYVQIVTQIKQEPVEPEPQEPEPRIPDRPLTVAEMVEAAKKRGARVVYVLERYTPESCTLYLPPNGERNVTNWTINDVLEWSKNFLGEDSWEILRSTRLGGRGLHTLYGNQEYIQENWGWDELLFTSIIAHYNKVMNHYHGYV